MIQFPAEGAAFLKALAENNNREWFTEHKAEYEKLVRDPGQALCDDVLAGLTGLVGPLKSKVFRIYRDVRFSKDKAPYNPYLRISFGNCEGDAHGTLAFFFGIEDGQAISGTGIFQFPADKLERFRSRLDELAPILASLPSADIPPPELKRTPAGLQDTSEHSRRKGLTAWIRTPADKGISSDQVLRELTSLLPLYRWLECL